MPDLHLVCGDYAARSVRAALGETAQIVVLRDDLAVGPLDDIDDAAPEKRARFWQEVLSKQEPMLPAMAGENAACRKLQEASSCIVWVGNDCAEQLMLHRIAWYCRDATTQLAVIDFGSENPAEKSSVALMTREKLAEYAATPRFLEQDERLRLAGAWERIRRHGGGVRFWRDRSVEFHPTECLDRRIVAAVSGEWQPVRPLLGRLMDAEKFLFVTDAFLAWRLRTLAASGVLNWRGEGMEADVCAYPNQREKRTRTPSDDRPS